MIAGEFPPADDEALELHHRRDRALTLVDRCGDPAVSLDADRFPFTQGLGEGKGMDPGEALLLAPAEQEKGDECSRSDDREGTAAIVQPRGPSDEEKGSDREKPRSTLIDHHDPGDAGNRAQHERSPPDRVAQSRRPRLQ